MKKNTILIILISLAVLSVNAFSQLKPVSGEQYAEFNGIFKKSKNLSRIETTISKAFKDKELVKTTKHIYEYLSESRSRQISYELDDKNEFMKKSENILFDGKYYSRNKEKEWRVWDVPKGGLPEPMGIESPRLDQYAIGETMLNGKKVRLFSHYQVIKNSLELSFFNPLYWISENGRIIQERRTSSSMFSDNVVSVSEITYDYDSKIEISPPKFAK